MYFCHSFIVETHVSMPPNPHIYLYIFDRSINCVKSIVQITYLIDRY